MQFMKAENYTNELQLLASGSGMTRCEFELLKAQLKHLSPSQLKSLQCEINASLNLNATSGLLTHEELDVIASLF
jgi:hypothetical protein